MRYRLVLTSKKEVLKLLASKIGSDAFQLDKSLASEADGPPQPHAPSALSTSL